MIYNWRNSEIKSQFAPTWDYSIAVYNILLNNEMIHKNNNIFTLKYAWCSLLKCNIVKLLSKQLSELPEIYGTCNFEDNINNIFKIQNGDSYSFIGGVIFLSNECEIILQNPFNDELLNIKGGFGTLILFPGYLQFKITKAPIYIISLYTENSIGNIPMHSYIKIYNPKKEIFAK